MGVPPRLYHAVARRSDATVGLGLLLIQLCFTSYAQEPFSYRNLSLTCCAVLRCAAPCCAALQARHAVGPAAECEGGH